MTTMAPPLRPAQTVREEIQDLQSYLAGLPSEWREAGSFLAYEEKLNALDHELALTRIAELAASLAGTEGHGRPTAELAADPQSLVQLLGEIEERYTRQAASHAKGNRWLSYAAFIASSATVASALLPLSLLLLPAAATAAGTAAALVLSPWLKQSHRETKLADYLRAIRNEVVYLSQDPHRIEPKTGAFPTSARVEALIAEITASQRESLDVSALR